MSAPSLTRDQAIARAATVEVDNYRIHLDLSEQPAEPAGGTFRSLTTVTFTATPGSQTFIDLTAETVRSVTLNGAPVEISDSVSSPGILLRGLAERNELVVDADCCYSRTGEGLHRFVDPADGKTYLSNQFEPTQAKRVFACFDQPDLKATFDVAVTAPADWEVVSLGATVGVEKDGDKATHTFATTARLSTYLMVICAGHYVRWDDVYTDEHGTIPLGILARASLAEYLDTERLFAETKQGFAFYHANFGVPYPFGKYDQIFCPEYNMGAMEHPGAVTFTEAYVFRSKVTRASYERRCNVVLHEMAHMWFGNLVTMRWWDDLWLNESFATFAANLAQADATEYTTCWTSFANNEKALAYAQDQLASTHPIVADIPDIDSVQVNFDAITYQKGASVLKQLAAYVGREPFLAGLRNYFTEHAYGNATLADLVRAVADSSGRDLSGWSAQWLESTGINTLRAEFTVTDGTFTSFAVVQEGAAPGAGEFRTHRMAIGIYSDHDGKLVRTKRIELDIAAAGRTEVPELVGVQRGALVLLNDDDLTYCSLRLDPDSLRTVLARIADIEDPLPRTLCWSAAWEMVRNAELRTRDYLGLVLRGIGAESEIAVVQRVLLQTQTALSRYADPDWAAETGWAIYTDGVVALARAAAPGSDHQLALVNALTGIAGPFDASLGARLPQRQLDLLAALLDGDPAEVGLPGLAVDTDLRWKIIRTLASAGRIDADGPATPVIDAELARDATDHGRRHAAAAAVARPQAAVKKAAWDRLLVDTTLANTTVRAIAFNFAPSGQEHLLTDYIDRYFAELPAAWERQSAAVAQTLSRALYPHQITTAAVHAAERFLAEEHPGPLRRLVLEGKDGVERALRARTFDATDR
ncbi:aminopeptidase N [Nocardia arthritidis]|uniref:aminopeptidase N n=1 Tax=Nocardia arthritidis TaxID=228602 RepID=UPI00142DA7DF|nr:aminopeptidase N [Nocardia arthritidis]